MSKLTGKVAIVTGASKGIGAGITKGLGAAGAAVVVNYASSQEAAERVVRIGILNAILLLPRGQRRAAAAARRCVSRVSTTSPGQHFTCTVNICSVY